MEEAINECLSVRAFSEVFFPFEECGPTLEQFGAKLDVSITREQSWKKEKDLYSSENQSRKNGNASTKLNNISKEPHDLGKGF
ncbi:MAG: hypothetical protein PG981_001233 [Wolbachia endosymbiont of Ctenocephalides orientis wCori]|nr:MAG: hypothetical protein PG981_001233 [Wolbachia endosymbiont of Ctenocephalides orientis wCori]